MTCIQRVQNAISRIRTAFEAMNRGTEIADLKGKLAAAEGEANRCATAVETFADAVAPQQDAAADQAAGDQQAAADGGSGPTPNRGEGYSDGGFQVPPDAPASA